MEPRPVRIGIIGAGAYARRRLIPGFRAIPGVEFVAVANSNLESSQRVAAENSIPIALGNWKELVSRNDIDAILVGTPPYLHHDTALAALDTGKHVMTVTRMCTTLREARQMAHRAESSGLVAAVHTAAKTSPLNRYVKKLIDDGYIGELRHALHAGYILDYPDAAAPISRRRDPEVFGAANVLSLGSSWDTMRFWFGDPARVVAWSKIFVPERPALSGRMVPVQMPEMITVVAELPSGASVTCIQSGVARFGEDRIEIFGQDGTLTVQDGQLFGGQAGDTRLMPLPIPAEFQAGRTPEQEFIAAIRGEIPAPAYTFWDGMKNILFLEAARTSAERGRWAIPPQS